MPADIDSLRRRIDEIDQQLVKLLNERAGCALKIGRHKEEQGLPIYQPAREAEVLTNVRAGNQGPLDDGAMTRLFERIIDEARRLERLAASAGTTGANDEAAAGASKAPDRRAGGTRLPGDGERK